MKIETLNILKNVKYFEELLIWKESIEHYKLVRQMINDSFEFKKDYSFKDQLLRSILSISSNIAEGFESGSRKQFVRYLYIAKASAGEARSQLYLAKEINYISEKDFTNIQNSISKLSSRIYNLITSLSE